MRVYAEVAKRSFRRHSTYRAATAAGAFTNTVFGFIQAYVMVAVYNARQGDDVADVERLCTRLVVIDHGRVIQDDTVAAVKARFGDTRTVVVDLEEPGPPLAVPHTEVVDRDGPRQWLRFNRGETTAAAVVTAVANQARLLDISIEEPDIEDVVRRIYTTAAPREDRPRV